MLVLGVDEVLLLIPEDVMVALDAFHGATEDEAVLAWAMAVVESCGVLTGPSAGGLSWILRSTTGCWGGEDRSSWSGTGNGLNNVSFSWDRRASKSGFSKAGNSPHWTGRRSARATRSWTVSKGVPR